MIMKIIVVVVVGNDLTDNNYIVMIVIRVGIPCYIVIITIMIMIQVFIMITMWLI